ncbi:MAG: integrase, partial [Methylococcaceae bacterium]
MIKEARKAYLLAIKKGYRQGDRAEKKLILDEFCEVCGYARKYAIRILNASGRSKLSRKKKSGPKPRYSDPALMVALKKIWFTSDQPCGKRLKMAIPIWLPHYEETFGALEQSIREQLLTISAARLDRLLKPVRAKNPKGLTGTKPGTLLKNQIPIRTHFWDETIPGFVEADTVAHCGNSLEG